MKLKEDLVLRQVADTWIILSMAQDVLNFDGILKLNESGAMLWNVLKETGDPQDLIDTLMKQYGVDKQVAQDDVDAFLADLKKAGCLEE